MTGDQAHADARTLATAESLLHRVRAGGDPDAAAALALLWLEPLHWEDAAAALIPLVLVNSPEHALARLVAGLLATRFWMDDQALTESESALLGLAGRPDREGAAAAVLLDEIQAKLGRPMDPARRLAIFDAGVKAEPSWVSPRARRALALATLGRTEEAYGELDAAALLLAAAPVEPDDPVEVAFRDCFTGLNWSLASIDRYRRRVENRGR